MPTCKDVARLIASDELGASRLERVGLRVHLLMCRFCRRYGAQVRAIGEVCGEQVGAVDEDPEVVRRLEQSILGEHRH